MRCFGFQRSMKALSTKRGCGYVLRNSKHQVIQEYGLPGMTFAGSDMKYLVRVTLADGIVVSL